MDLFDGLDDSDDSFEELVVPEGVEIFLDGWESDFSDDGPDEEPPPDTSPPASPTFGPSSPQPPPPKKRGNSIGARILALKRFDDGVPHEKITQETEITRSSIYKLRAKAISRGWKEGDIVEPFHVDDAPRPRRPKISTVTALFIIETMTKNSVTRGWSTAQITDEVSYTPGWQPVSRRTVYRVLTDAGYGVFKRTIKPGLTEEMKKARLKWCLDHKDWTLEDWKNVIFSDETSVQLGGIRGRRRVWRKNNEAYHHHVTVRRWKGFSEFIWWSCFSYDEKGPYHIWTEETPAEKAACKKDLKARNSARYSSDLAKWELEDAMRRIHITRNQPGARAQFKHTEATGAYVLKDGKGGINWYRYQKKILEPLLLPFAKKCLEKRPGTIVQEDKAPAHASRYQQEIFDIWEIQRLLWPGNSPDLNTIEPTWFWMKRETTKNGIIRSKEQLKKDWIKCWEGLPQEKIQAWIERIPIHIQEIIDCEGDNLYKEGRKKGQSKQRIH
jgi:hypothetical protein